MPLAVFRSGSGVSDFSLARLFLKKIALEDSLGLPRDIKMSRRALRVLEKFSGNFRRCLLIIWGVEVHPLN